MRPRHNLGALKESRRLSILIVMAISRPGRTILRISIHVLAILASVRRKARSAGSVMGRTVGRRASSEAASQIKEAEDAMKWALGLRVIRCLVGRCEWGARKSANVQGGAESSDSAPAMRVPRGSTIVSSLRQDRAHRRASAPKADAKSVVQRPPLIGYKSAT